MFVIFARGTGRRLVCFVKGQVQRSKKPQQVRGLNRNHNHEIKEVFKSAATRASCGKGPFRDFYAGLLAKGMKPGMARLTLARREKTQQHGSLGNLNGVQRRTFVSLYRESERAGKKPQRASKICLWMRRGVRNESLNRHLLSRQSEVAPILL
jgi:hypothetical protein